MRVVVSLCGAINTTARTDLSNGNAFASAPHTRDYFQPTQQAVGPLPIVAQLVHTVRLFRINLDGNVSSPVRPLYSLVQPYCVCTVTKLTAREPDRKSTRLHSSHL